MQLTDSLNIVGTWKYPSHSSVAIENGGAEMFRKVLVAARAMTLITVMPISDPIP